MWTLLAAFLVMFMQAGFALVETGMTRAKNVAHTMAMNLMIYAVGMLGFYCVGFGLMFGGLHSDPAIAGRPLGGPPCLSTASSPSKASASADAPPGSCCSERHPRPAS